MYERLTIETNFMQQHLSYHNIEFCIMRGLILLLFLFFTATQCKYYNSMKILYCFSVKTSIIYS